VHDGYEPRAQKSGAQGRQRQVGTLEIGPRELRSVMNTALDQAAAIAKIKDKMAQIATLERQPRFCAEFKKWRRDTEVLLQRIFGPSAYQVGDFVEIDFIFRGMHKMGDTVPFESRYRNALKESFAILTSIYEEIEEFGISVGDSTVNNPMSAIEKIAVHFHAVTRQLRARHAGRETLDVKDEYDVQDLLYALLKIFFKDIRQEEWTPSYAGNSSRMDFLLHQEEIVIEVKMTREGLKQKELVDQLLVDIARYEEHPACKSLVCFVYDPAGWIGNPAALIGDVEKGARKIAVRVFVQPEQG
jgi:REase_DpnII-MboI